MVAAEDGGDDEGGGGAAANLVEVADGSGLLVEGVFGALSAGEGEGTGSNLFEVGEGSGFPVEGVSGTLSAGGAGGAKGISSGAMVGADVGVVGVDGSEDDNESDKILTGPGAGGGGSEAVVLAEPGRITGFGSSILFFGGPGSFLAST